MKRDDIDPGKFSGYNEASYKMARIHDLQQVINNTNYNLLAYDIIKKEYNYEIKFSAISSLFAEVYSKCSEKETKEAERKRKIILLLLEVQQPFEIIKDERIATKQRKKFNNIHYEKLKQNCFYWRLSSAPLRYRYVYARSQPRCGFTIS